MARQYRVINGCPCPASIAPFVAIVMQDAGQTATSIYRGGDPVAVKILHSYGKHTQAEIHADPRYAAISNPPGFSQHELKSDGSGNHKVPRGGDLHEWQIGVDSGGDSQTDKDHVTNAARRNGWRIRHPYSAGVEGHHWCFDVKPKAKGVRQRVRVMKLRATLPRR